MFILKYISISIAIISHVMAQNADTTESSMIIEKGSQVWTLAILKMKAIPTINLFIMVLTFRYLEMLVR